MHRQRVKYMSPLQRKKYNPEARAHRRALATVFVVVGILLCGCSMGIDEGDNPRATREVMTMVQTSKSTILTAPTPPIDAVAHTRVETSTFALG